MNNVLTRLAIAGALSLALAPAAFAEAQTKAPMHEMNQQVKVGDLAISGAFARATLPGAPVGGAFLTIENQGDQDDRLVSATADFAGMTQLHNMRMEGEVMKMYQMENGIPLPAHETVQLAPGGLHVMFMKLKQPLVEGDTVEVELTFEKAGAVTIDLPVESFAAKTMEGMDHGK
ncbi:copper chaperone PCu(A)C [Martelella radicis]|uniref:Copper(I)-binding protein n=1 Tax=Martelella radicis TaxID=1397476 RepID=A0A7W6KKI5_9HYPH|nr:copper chaperone PCu(A)C [Martelella radicis]MBB4122976.1 copper(I)-binding protein [Martelella radicis]